MAIALRPFAPGMIGQAPPVEKHKDGASICFVASLPGFRGICHADDPRSALCIREPSLGRLFAYGSQIAVEPVQRLFDLARLDRHMTEIEQHVAFLVLRGA